MPFPVDAMLFFNATSEWHSFTEYMQKPLGSYRHTYDAVFIKALCVCAIKLNINLKNMFCFVESHVSKINSHPFDVHDVHAQTNKFFHPIRFIVCFI